MNIDLKDQSAVFRFLLIGGVVLLILLIFIALASNATPRSNITDQTIIKENYTVSTDNGRVIIEVSNPKTFDLNKAKNELGITNQEVEVIIPGAATDRYYDDEIIDEKNVYKGQEQAP